MNNSQVIKHDSPQEMLRRDINVSSLENTFANFKNKPGTKEAFDAFVKYADGKLGTPFLVCIGNYGCGKTHLLEALVIKRNEMGLFCRVIKFNKFIQSLKNSINSNEIPSYDQIISGYCTAKMLFLDDVGMGSKETSWYTSVLETVVDERYHHRLETVITMNKEAFKSLPPRVVSRFTDGEICTMVENTGADYRGLK